MIIECIVVGLSALAVGGGVAGTVAFKAGVSHRRKTAEAAIGSAEAEAERILKDAKAAAESKKKETLLEAKDEIHRLRNESERELKERRNEVVRQERRIQQKEEALDHKIENYEAKEPGCDERSVRVQQPVQSSLAPADSKRSNTGT